MCYIKLDPTTTRVRKANLRRAVSKSRRVILFVRNSNNIRPLFTGTTQSFGNPFPLPIRIPLVRPVTAFAGRILIHNFSFLLLNARFKIMRADSI